MNKLISKIVGACLGISMAAGVSVSVAVGNDAKDVKQVEAIAAGDVFERISAASDLSTGDEIIFVNQAETYACGTTQNTNNRTPVAISTSNHSYIYAQNGNVQVFTVKKNNNGAFGFHTGSGYIYSASSSSNNLKTNTTAYSTAPSGTAAWNLTISNYVASATNVTNTSYYLAFNGTSYFSQYKQNMIKPYIYKRTGSGAYVTGVTVNGDMNKKSYNTFEAWSNTGLTPAATMSDSSQYSGSFSWGYNPTSPLELVKANKDAVTSGSVIATATAEGQSGSKTVSGISVACGTVAQAITNTPSSGTKEAIVKGIVSQIVSIDISTYYNATYYISDDGTTTNQFEVYRGKYLNNTNFTNANELKIGDEVIVYGNLKTYSSTKEFDSGNYLLKLTRNETSDPEITITESSFTMNVGDADVTLHATTENFPSGGSIRWVSDDQTVATVGASTGVVHAVGTGVAEITAQILDSNDEIVATNSINVTVTNITYPVGDGDSFIVYCTYNSTTYYFTSIVNDIGQYSTTKSEAAIFTAEEGETTNQLYLEFEGGYLNYTGSDNKVYTSATKVDSALWTIVNDGFRTTIANVAKSDRHFKFNTASGSERFCCYTSASNIDVELIAAPEVESVTVTGDSTAYAGGAVSVAKEFLYEVTYAQGSTQGNSGVTVSVVGAQSGTSGATVTSAPSEGSFTVTFTANDTFIVTVTSKEDTTQSDSTTIVVSGIYEPVLADYSLYSGTTVSGNVILTEGDYVIYYSGKAMNTTIDGDRAQYEEVTPEDDVITTGDSSIVWHIAKNGDYYTIYNAEAGKYLASTGAKNKAQLLANKDDNKSLWTITISNGTFEFVNKQNTTNGVNANLRCNGTYGFACYATSTGGALSLYKKAYDAAEYARMFTDGITCDSSGTDAPSTAEWALLDAMYDEVSTSGKTTLQSADAVEHSNPSTETEIIESAMAKYDYIIRKYNITLGLTTQYPNFISRSVSSSSYVIASVVENTAALTTIIVISALSVTTLGAYFLLRKKKEER